ncbi:nucleoside deaminase [Micromonospora sp. NPDC049679]|uniref:nucleoside deaminase n=1 Tax=Micromonospora sp. NPDC049679 TaxID=3155920 RepID=UPI0033CB7766
MEDDGKTPFGAIVVVEGDIVGEGATSVVELRDPTPHAEVMALRHAGAKLGRHLFDDGVMYASSEPCPMCLVACYWARIPRLIFGASSHDVATHGFEDLRSTETSPSRSNAGRFARTSLRTRSVCRLSTFSEHGGQAARTGRAQVLTAISGAGGTLAHTDVHA